MSRTRTIRDPIHGDIVVGPLEASVVDTRIFQRLRYIRQNGLLHFVFPGAVHTRFAHSLGAMCIAGKVFDHLFAKCPTAVSGELIYLRHAFQLAALLHDVGHCAFSHSIERVAHEGKPLLGSVGEFFASWNESELEAAYTQAHPGEAGRPVRHEQIGLALIRRIFDQDNVKATALGEGIAPEDMWVDVCALVDGALPASERYQTAVASVLGALFTGGVDVSDQQAAKRLVDQLTAWLHSLISGTLDVDRLDYLVRDSMYCGVPYGQCEVSFLITGLSLEVLDSRIELCISRKSARALDDMLWSRYQLFIQVLNHKTNVALNAALCSAIEDAIDDQRIKKPVDYTDYLEFTDDLVMSTIFSASLRNPLESKTYTKALIDRKIPHHIVEFDADDPAEPHISNITSRFGVTKDQILRGEAQSEFVKGNGPLPTVVGWDRMTSQRTAQRFKVASIKDIDLKYHRVHLFLDRDLAETKSSQ